MPCALLHTYLSGPGDSQLVSVDANYQPPGGRSGYTGTGTGLGVPPAAHSEPNALLSTPYLSRHSKSTGCTPKTNLGALRNH